jgi:hypothetical protein
MRFPHQLIVSLNQNNLSTAGKLELINELFEKGN